MKRVQTQWSICILVALICSCTPQERINYNPRIDSSGSLQDELSWRTKDQAVIVRIPRGSEEDNVADDLRPALEEIAESQVMNPVDDQKTAEINKAAPITKPDISFLYGNWVIDAEGTIAENPFLKTSIKEMIKKELTENPFDLEIGNGLYISRSRTLTRIDMFDSPSLQDGMVTILLASTCRDSGSDGAVIKLRLKEGKLLLSKNGLTFMLSVEGAMNTSAEIPSSAKVALESEIKPGYHMVTADKEYFLTRLKKEKIKLWGLRGFANYHYIQSTAGMKASVAGVAERLNDGEMSIPFKLDNKYWIIQKVGN